MRHPGKRQRAVVDGDVDPVAEIEDRLGGQTGVDPNRIRHAGPAEIRTSQAHTASPDVGWRLQGSPKGQGGRGSRAFNVNTSGGKRWDVSDEETKVEFRGAQIQETDEQIEVVDVEEMTEEESE